MTRTRLATSALLALLFVGAPAHAPKSTTVGPVASVVAAPVSVVGGSAEDTAMAETALKRFAVAGMNLPALIIEFVGPSLEPCGGAQARAHLDRSPITVSVCWGDPFVLLHELAHVWTFGTVIESQEVAFMGLRTDVHAWADGSDAWENQGREHAANVIAWGLIEDPQVVSRTYPNDRASLTEAFTILTGIQPLHTQGGEPVIMNRAAFESAVAVERQTGQ